MSLPDKLSMDHACDMLEYLAEDQYEKLHRNIGQSFAWWWSPQGDPYWLGVRYRLEDIFMDKTNYYSSTEKLLLATNILEAVQYGPNST